MTPTDEELAARVADGELQLFETLMRRSNTRVYRTLRAILRNETEIEDAMQATYLHAYTKLSTFRGESRFSTWLTRIAVNEALGRMRTERRHPAVSLTVVEEPMTSPREESPEAHTERRELAKLIERAVDSLPESHRIVFMLRDVDGMDTAETATVLDVSQDVVKTRLSRARAALRESLEKEMGTAVPEAFGFHASRCDRVVAGVMQTLDAGPR